MRLISGNNYLNINNNQMAGLEANPLLPDVGYECVQL